MAASTSSTPPPPTRAMTPHQLPKLILQDQPAWYDESELRKNEAYFGFRRELALKKLLSCYDEDEIEDYLRLDDGDWVIGEVFRDLGLDPEVHGCSLRGLFDDLYIADREEESEGSEMDLCYEDDEYLQLIEDSDCEDQVMWEDDSEEYQSEDAQQEQEEYDEYDDEEDARGEEAQDTDDNDADHVLGETY
ncbi:hypothetical protein PG997_013650 [Apiospora hydei]|uniref:CCD97-like C-terminal domain-containing protein n=1 Tax=Apiospora hydei TaxID=1337664 RepID=A0ABR1VAB7_9PEZI